MSEYAPTRIKPERPLFHSTTPYCMVRSQEDGERDIVALACSLDHESAWDFIPYWPVWFSTTIAIFNQEATMIEEGKTGVLHHSLLYGPDITEAHRYHTHPVHCLQREENNLIRIIEENNRKRPKAVQEKSIAYTQNVKTIEGELPSTADVQSAIGAARKNAHCQLYFHIGSRHGMISMELAEDQSVFEGLDNRYCAAKMRVQTALPEDLLAPLPTRVEALEKAILEINDEMNRELFLGLRLFP